MESTHTKFKRELCIKYLIYNNLYCLAWVASIFHVYIFILGPVLTPTSVQLLQPMSSTSNNNTEKPTLNKNVPVGSTWKNSGNINIDLDNLLTNKPKTGKFLFARFS